jgi:prevent-host-death family protein
MRRVGIADLKAHLSSHLRKVRRGEVLVVMDRDTPVARVVPFGERATGLVTRRPTGELRAFQAPPPLGTGVDSLSALLDERQGQR